MPFNDSEIGRLEIGAVGGRGAGRKIGLPCLVACVRIAVMEITPMLMRKSAGYPVRAAVVAAAAAALVACDRQGAQFSPGLVAQPTGGKVTGQQREQIEEAVRQHDEADGPGDAQAGEVRETGEKAE